MLMDYPINFDTISMRWSILYFLRGHRSYFQNFDIFLSLKIVFILANSADPCEMRHHSVFYLRFAPFAKVPVYHTF